MLDDVEAEEPPAAPATTAAPRSPADPPLGAPGLVLASVLALLLAARGRRPRLGLRGPRRRTASETVLNRVTPVEAQAPAPPEPAQQTDEEAAAGPTRPRPPTRLPPRRTRSRVAAAAERPVREAARRPSCRFRTSRPTTTTSRRTPWRASGFDVRSTSTDYREGFAARGVTWATEPAAGTLAPEGSTVTVYATPQDLPPRPVF